jgi:RimJ/RimL family protein N-acetyltransferase
MTLRSRAQLPELVIRPIRPDDKDALVAGLQRLSDRSVHQRFLSPKPRFTRSELRYLTEVDFTDHYALVAVLARAPDVLVAVGRWVRDADSPDSAEVAVVVADVLQGRGVGTRLGRDLVDAARERGITRLTATMLPSNRAAHRLFAELSAQLEAPRLAAA